jgi:hypothetical protein
MIARVAAWPELVHIWGTSEAERLRPYPCDEMLRDPDQVMFRAVDVEAPQGHVFRWLCQLRLAPYSYDWIDNFGRQSPRRLVPGLDELETGQTFMRIFELAGFEPGTSITLVSDTPRGVRSVVSYVAEPHGPAGSRLLVKYGVEYSRPRLAAPLRLVLPPGDLIMMRRQLLNLKRLAEASLAETG